MNQKPGNVQPLPSPNDKQLQFLTTLNQELVDRLAEICNLASPGIFDRVKRSQELAEVVMGIVIRSGGRMVITKEMITETPLQNMTLQMRQDEDGSIILETMSEQAAQASQNHLVGPDGEPLT